MTSQKLFRPCVILVLLIYYITIFFVNILNYVIFMFSFISVKVLKVP